MWCRAVAGHTVFSNGARDMTKTDTVKIRRHSAAISRAVTQSVFDAFRYAAASGTPLNTYAVVNLRNQAGEEATRVFEIIRHKYRDWLMHLRKIGRTKISPIYVFAFENPGEVPHVNWVLHIPSGLESEFANKLPRWVEKAQGSIGDFDVNIQDVTLERTAFLAKYILKGTQETHIDHFYLSMVYDGPQGSIWGKRAGSSPSIGKSARQKAGFNRKKHRAVYQPKPASAVKGARIRTGSSASSGNMPRAFW
jgi:hypothetical protein